MSNDELYHHGVLGQKWGIRRYQNEDGSLTARGRVHYGVGLGRDEEKEKAIKRRPKTLEVLNRTAKDKAMIRDIQKWEDDERKHILRGKQLVHQSKIMAYKMGRVFDDVDEQARLPKLKTPDSPEQAVKKTNISKGTHLASGNNCCLCTIAYDLRRRGYDVVANQNAPINLLYDIGYEDVAWMYGFAPKKQGVSKNAKELTQKLGKEPNGSRGAAFCSWAGGNGGHVVAYEIENGKPILYDAQTGNRYDSPEKLFDDVTETYFIRLDDKKPNYNYARIAVE